MIHYGLGLGRALHQTADIEAVSVYEKEAARSRVASDLLKTFAHRLYPFRKTFDKLRTLIRLLHSIKKYRPKVIHFTDGVERPLYGFVLFPLLRTLAPIVVTVHDPVPHSGVSLLWRERLAKRLAFRLANHFIVHGPFCKQLLIGQGIRPDLISIQHHGVIHFPDDHPEDARREPQTILFFGRFQPNKGMDLLVPVADRIHSRFPNARFIVAGSSGMLLKGKRRALWEKELKSILTAMRERSCFEVHEGFVPDEQISHYFRRAAITLLPYRDATQSGVAPIALSFETALVTTNAGDLPELIRHGETGMLCRTDVDSISDNICELLGNSEKLRRIAQSGKEHAATFCEWTAIAKETAGIYRRVLSS